LAEALFTHSFSCWKINEAEHHLKKWTKGNWFIVIATTQFDLRVKKIAPVCEGIFVHPEVPFLNIMIENSANESFSQIFFIHHLLGQISKVLLHHFKFVIEFLLGSRSKSCQSFGCKCPRQMCGENFCCRIESLFEGSK
jgi:hypothetical protein